MGGGGGGAKQVAMCLRGDARTLLCTFRSNRKVDRHSVVGPPVLLSLSSPFPPFRINAFSSGTRTSGPRSLCPTCWVVYSRGRASSTDLEGSEFSFKNLSLVHKVN